MKHFYIHWQYTFILPASKALPKQCIRHGSTTTFTTRKNVGVRIPDDSICQAILEKLKGPLISTRSAELIYLEEKYILVLFDQLIFTDIHKF